MSFRLLIVALGLMMMSHSLAAQENRDVIHLKNGDRFRGRVLEYSNDQSLTFLTSLGDTISATGDQMALIQKVRIGKSSYLQKTEGWWHTYEFGVGLDVQGYSTPTDNFSLQSTVGYQWSRLLKAGLGLGYEGQYEVLTLPIFASVQGEWYDNKVTPYHFVNVGYAIGWERDYGESFSRYDEVSGGFRFNPGIGLRFYGAKSSFTMAFGYLVQGANLYNSTENELGEVIQSLRIDRYFKSISVRLGLAF